MGCVWDGGAHLCRLVHFQHLSPIALLLDDASFVSRFDEVSSPLTESLSCHLIIFSAPWTETKAVKDLYDIDPTGIARAEHLLLLQPTTGGNQGGLSLDLCMLSLHSTHARMSSGLMNANLYENSHSCCCLRRDPCFLATCANKVLWYSVVPSIFPVILLLSKEYNWRELQERSCCLLGWGLPKTYLICSCLYTPGVHVSA